MARSASKVSVRVTAATALMGHRGAHRGHSRLRFTGCTPPNALLNRWLYDTLDSFMRGLDNPGESKLIDLNRCRLFVPSSLRVYHRKDAVQTLTPPCQVVRRPDPLSYNRIPRRNLERSWYHIYTRSVRPNHSPWKRHVPNPNSRTWSIRHHSIRPLILDQQLHRD